MRVLEVGLAYGVLLERVVINFRPLLGSIAIVLLIR